VTIPNVGVTGVIQNPGVGGSIAQGIGGIAQMLLKQQELKRQAEIDALNKRQVEAQIATAAANREAALALAEKQARIAKQQGKGLRDIVTPQSVNVPALPTGIDGVQSPAVGVNLPPQTAEQAIAGMDDEAIAGFLEQARPILTERREQEAALAAQKAGEEALVALPEGLRGTVGAMIQLNQAGLPAGVQTELIKQIAAQADPEAMAAMRTQYPLLASLPDTEFLKQVSDIKGYETQVRMQLGPEYDRQRSRQLAGARLALDQAKNKMEGGTFAQQRQAAGDFLNMVTETIKTDFTTFGQPVEARVRALFGEGAVGAYQKALTFRIEGAKSVVFSPPAVASTTEKSAVGETTKNTLSPIQTPSVLLRDPR